MLTLTLPEAQCMLEIALNGMKVTNGEFKSWEHCYKAFGGLQSDYDSAIKSSNTARSDEIERYLALMLFTYLASWGMYRGSSFLRKYDYTVHIETVRIVYEYWTLRGCANASDYTDYTNMRSKLNEYYVKLKNDLLNKQSEEVKTVSKTLLTKIILGTLGCTPAYDTYLNTAMSALNDVKKNKAACPDSLPQIEEWWKTYGSTVQSEFLFSLKGINNPGCINTKLYPPMRLMDMILFTYGYLFEKYKYKAAKRITFKDCKAEFDKNKGNMSFYKSI